MPKATKEMLEFIIENPYRMSFAAIGRKFNVHHTTILNQVKKLRKAGFVIPKYYDGNYAGHLDKLIAKIKEEKKRA